MYYKILFALLIITIIFSVQGCFHKEDQANSPTELEGFWLQNCRFNNIDGTWEHSSVLVEGNTYTANQFKYDELLCTLPEYSLELIANFSIGKEIILITGETVKEIDISIVNISISPESERLHVGYNNSALCGITNWELGVKSDITNCVSIRNGTKIYDIFKLDNNIVSFGDNSSGDGISKENRPTQLEFSTYIKTEQ